MAAYLVNPKWPLFSHIIMGCFGSKQEATGVASRRPETSQPPPRTGQQRPAMTANRQAAPVTRAGVSSRHQDLSDRRPASSRRQNPDRRPNSSRRQNLDRRPTTAQRRSRVPGTIPETEDIAIHHGLKSLATMINQHSLNFYGANAHTTSREIGQMIVNEAILGDTDGTPPHTPDCLSPRLSCE